jgi:lipoprotein NlpI
MTGQSELPRPPWARDPTLLERLLGYLLALILAILVLSAPIWMYIIFQETVGDWFRKPHRQQAQHIRELTEKAGELRRAEDWDEAIKVYTEIIESKAKQPDELFASVYLLRANCYVQKGDLNRGIADYTMSIALNPKEHRSYLLRGRAYRERGEYERAIADHTKAFELAPTDASNLKLRAFAQYLKGEYAGAAEDWRTALQYLHGRQEMIYCHLWLFVALAHLEIDGTIDLSAYHNRQRSPTKWPMAIVAMLLGKTSPDELLRSASEGEDSLKRKCEAHFYIAHYYLVNSHNVLARAHLQQCLDTGVTDYYEYKAAEVDINRIDK